MRAIGVDIADTVISLVDVRQRFGACTLLGYAQHAVPQGAVEHGVIRDPQAVATALTQCMAAGKPKPLVAKAAVFSVPESTVFTHTFTFPRTLKDKEIEQGIRVQFSEYFPMEIEQMAMDWHVMQKSEQTQSVLVGACEKAYTKNIATVAALCGMTVQRIDIESISAARAILPIPKKMEGLLLIDSGASVTSLSIFDDCGLHMTVSLQCAGRMVTEQIAKKRTMPLAKAEEWKKQVQLNDPAAADVVSVLDAVYGPVHAEAKRMMHYFEQTTSKKIAAVYLCGGALRMHGMDAYMQAHIPRPIVCGNPLQHLRHHDILPTSEDVQSYTNAIGLTLATVGPKHRGAFNLLPQQS